MRQIRDGILALFAVGVLGGCQTLPTPASEPISLAITNVTVIDPETKRVMSGRSVYVKGDRIHAIVPAISRPRYRAARTIDGTGKFLIPGLMDMHVHLFLPEPTAPSLNLLLANGVTAMREMSGDCWEVAGAKEGCIRDYRLLQSKLRTGEVVGPEIVSIASTMVMGPSRQQLPKELPSFIVPKTADEARMLVRYLHGRGVDFIKTHDSIPPAAFAAMVSEARSLGLQLAGHIPFKAGAAGAIQVGYRSIEHARDLLYDCSRYGSEYRRLESAFAQGLDGAERPPSLTRLRRTVDEFDPNICAAMLGDLSRSRTFYVPTHVTREMEARAGDLAYRNDGNRKYILPGPNKNWEADLAETAAKPGEEIAALNGFFRHGLRVTGLAHRAGVAIMAGTDASDTMIVPGFSLHKELSLLAEAGLSPMEVLRSATSVPASYLGRTKLNGGVSVGKEADLILLDANPLENIRNTSTIAAVLTDGRLFDRAALDALLVEVEQMAKRGA
jgi:imidazolonepropionase-like amidohydrolase